MTLNACDGLLVFVALNAASIARSAVDLAIARLEVHCKRMYGWLVVLVTLSWGPTAEVEWVGSPSLESLYGNS